MCINSSNDLIRRVDSENFEENIKKFEIIRVAIKATFGPIVGFCWDQMSKLDKVKSIDFTRRDSVLLIPVLALGKDRETFWPGLEDQNF